MRLLAVTLGGALGSAARYLVQGWVQERASARTGWIALFPLGTLSVNLAGCFAIGLLATLLQERLLVAPELRSFVLLGLLGGFTTFSSFGFETLALARAGNLPLALGNVAASVGLGLVGVWLGTALARLG
jgi:CrcB protein